MENINIFTECPDPAYYSSLYHLQRVGKLQLVMRDSRTLYLFAKLLGFGATYKKVTLVELARSFISPFALLKEKNIVVGFAPYSLWVYYLLFLKLLKKNIVYSTSWPNWKDRTRWVHRPFFSRRAWDLFLRNLKIMAPTQAVCRSASFFGAQCYLIPHGVDTTIFFRKKIEHTGVRALYVGRLVREKGIYELLGLAQQFKEIEFWIVGDGPLRDFVKNTKGNVRYLGKIVDKKKLAEVYNSCDIFLLLSQKTKSWEEWFGITLVEAMSCGLPVIATDSVGPREIIKDSINGFVVKNKGELFFRFLYLTSHQQERKRFGDRSRDLATEYALDTVSFRLQKVLKIKPV